MRVRKRHLWPSQQFKLGFPIGLGARDQQGLFFRILTPLCMVASIFHRLSVFANQIRQLPQFTRIQI